MGDILGADLRCAHLAGRGLASVLLSVVLGVALGLVAGFRGGYDGVLMPVRRDAAVPRHP